jgi:hypothetical protein
MQSTLMSPLETRQPVPSEDRKPDRWWIVAARIVFWQLLAIFVVELCLAIAGLGEEEIFKLDPVLGCKHMCNKKVTWRSEGFATSYFDADGMREHGLTIAKAPGTFRVAVLGDSLSESLQVPVDESFTSQIQQSLSRQLTRPVQLLNFSVSGYSTVQEHLQLKQQVLKYKPDLVMLCYNVRDCFENWSPPDEVLTNVRPTAVHLPGRQLMVNSASVAQWLKSPRARFLQNIGFLRQNSRLWGLFAAAELDWSLHNPAYKKTLLLFTRPGPVIRQSMSELKAYWQNTCRQISGSLQGPAGAAASQTGSGRRLQLAEKSAGQSGAPAAPAAASNKPAGAAAAPAEKPAEKSTGNEKGESIYLSLIERTLGSLIGEMKATSNANGAQFVVVINPVHSALSEKKGRQSSSDGFDFNSEVRMLQRICGKRGIDLVNVHEKAKSLSKKDGDSLFYVAHLTPKGQEFMAQHLEPVVKDCVKRSSLK